MTSISYKDTGATSLAQAVGIANSKAPAGGLIDLILPVGSLQLGDFTDYNAALQLRNVNLRGAGAGKTMVDLRGPFTTKLDPALTTNPFYAIMASSGKANVIEGLTLDCSAVASNQHLFGGIRMGAGGGVRTLNPRINDVQVVGVPGSLNTPPGETFGINLWNCDGAVLDTVEVDGYGRGAAGVGLNSSNGSTIHALKSHDNAHSHGITFWQCAGAQMSDCDLLRNGTASPSGVQGAGLNIERTHGIIARRLRLVDNTLACIRVFTDNEQAWPSNGHTLSDSLGYGAPYSIFTQGLAHASDIIMDGVTRLIGPTGAK